MKNVILYFLLSALLLFSCKENDEKPPFDNNTFYENHQAANWTRETAKEHLQGTWELVYIYCCGNGVNNGWSKVEDQYFQLQFEGDSVKVFKETNLDQKQYWKFDDRDGEALYLETKEPISNTFGNIFFSQNYMLFNGAPSDGSNSYFLKIE